MKPSLPLLLVVVAMIAAGCSDTRAKEGCGQDAECAQGQSCCGGACLDVTADSQNCGACGVTCSAEHGTASCVQSQCQIACDPGFADCDLRADTGCEVHTDADLGNCGACSQSCTADHGTPRCQAGSCQIASCEDGFQDCDGVPSTGCEVHVSDDPAHCGACDVQCGSGERCVQGACKALTLLGFGGIDERNGFHDELWRFDIYRKTFKFLSPAAPDGSPGARAATIGAWDAQGQRLIVYGGQAASTPLAPIVWALDFSTDTPTWKKLPQTPENPGSRSLSCTAVDPGHRTLYVFGGQDDGSFALGDFWSLDLGTGAWTKISDGGASDMPTATASASCAFIPESGWFVLFGGDDPATSMPTNQLWAWDTRNPADGWIHLTAPSSPTARSHASFFQGFSPVRLFGGWNVDHSSGAITLLNDVNALQLSAAGSAPSWTSELANGVMGAPTQRALASTAELDGTGYLYGGITDVVKLTLGHDLWAYDPSARSWSALWDEGMPGGPVAGAGVLMVAPY